MSEAKSSCCGAMALSDSIYLCANCRQPCHVTLRNEGTIDLTMTPSEQADTIPRAQWAELRAWVERAAEITPQTNEQTIPWRQAMRDVLRTMEQLERGDDDN